MKRLRRIAILIFCEFHLLLLLTTTDGRTFRYLRGMSYCSMDVERSPNIRVVPSAENQKANNASVSYESTGQFYIEFGTDLPSVTLESECFMRVLNATKKSSYLIKAEQLDPDGATIVHLFNDIALMAFGYDDSFLDLKISEPAKKEQPPQFIMPPESTQSETAKTLPNLKVLAIPPLYSSNGMAIGNNNMQFIPLTNNSSSRSYNANNATNFATAPIRLAPVN